ncbi:hypothetical protein FRB95_002366 [Tulasnella sp. JGI-2019a]|nr:hypothetical protein FRB95_002366 [Tulasnella sp. JGI-2019a]
MDPKTKELSASRIAEDNTMEQPRPHIETETAIAKGIYQLAFGSNWNKYSQETKLVFEQV